MKEKTNVKPAEQAKQLFMNKNLGDQAKKAQEAQANLNNIIQRIAILGAEIFVMMEPGQMLNLPMVRKGAIADKSGKIPEELLGHLYLVKPTFAMKIKTNIGLPAQEAPIEGPKDLKDPIDTSKEKKKEGADGDTGKSDNS